MPRKLLVLGRYGGLWANFALYSKYFTTKNAKAKNNVISVYSLYFLKSFNFREAQLITIVTDDEIKNSVPDYVIGNWSHDYEMIVELLKSLDNKYCSDYHTWFRIAVILKNELKVPFQLFDEWSGMSMNYGNTNEIWKSITPEYNQIKLGTLFYYIIESNPSFL